MRDSTQQPMPYILLCAEESRSYSLMSLSLPRQIQMKLGDREVRHKMANANIQVNILEMKSTHDGIVANQLCVSRNVTVCVLSGHQSRRILVVFCM